MHIAGPLLRGRPARHPPSPSGIRRIPDPSAPGRHHGAPGDLHVASARCGPAWGRTVMEMLDRGREPGAAAEFAARTSAEIPIATAGVGKLLESYLGSPLVRFHRDFYETCPHEPERWAETYDRLDLTSMIPCVGEALMRPNDLLLNPEHLQHRDALSDGVRVASETHRRTGAFAIRARLRVGRTLDADGPPGSSRIRRARLRRDGGDRSGPGHRLQLPIGAGEGALPGRGVHARSAARPPNASRTGEGMSWRIGMSTGCCLDKPILQVLDAM